MAGAYENAYAEFARKFNLNGFNIKEEYEENRALNGIQDFEFGSSQKKEQSTYLDTLTTALETYLKEKTKIQPGKEYDLSDVSVVDFVREFDKVINAIRTDMTPEGETYQHIPFANLQEGVMASHAWKNIKKFNEPLHAIWADQIRDGTLTLDNLQNFASNSVSALDTKIQNGEEYTEDLKKDLATVVMAKKAMETAINKRSWTSWLNPRNWGPNLRENDRLKELKAKLTTYQNAGYPVNDVVPKNYTARMLGNTLNELNNTYRPKKQEPDPAEKEQKEIKRMETSIKAAIRSADNFTEAKRTSLRPQVSELMQKKLVGLMTNCEGDAKDKADRAKSLYNTLGAQLMETWKDKSTLGTAAVNMFKEAYKMLDGAPGMNTADKLVAAQEMTDLMMNYLSPAVKDPDLSAYCDSYAMCNLSDKNIQELTGYEGDVSEFAKNARDRLGLVKVQVEDKSASNDKNNPDKDRIEIPELSGKDKGEKTVPKIEEIQHNALNKSIT